MTALRILLAIASIAISATVLAQFPGGPRGGSQGGVRNDPRPPRDSSTMRQERGNSPGATTQSQLDAIEDDLKLTEVQRPLWYAYADQVQRLGDTMSRMRFEARTGIATQGGTMLEQLDRIADEEKRRAAAVEQIAAAARALYATLTAEQKRIADGRFTGPVMDLTFGNLSVRTEEPIQRGGVRERR